MKWTVETLGLLVDAELRALPTDMMAAFLRLSERIETVGLDRIGQPYVKHLEGKLWEMRLRGGDGIARALYITMVGRRVIVVHAFVKKSRKTPRAAIELALRRAKEIAF